MLRLMLITNDPALAHHAAVSGVGRIMVDTEVTGKAERQAGKDMVFCGHRIEDVRAVRTALTPHPDCDLLLRVNPVHAGTRNEIAAGAAHGAQAIMVPMVTTVAEVEHAAAACREHRLPLIPLIETPAALARLERICKVPGVAEVYLGLNDLHLAMGLDFLFEPVAAGLMDLAAGICQTAGLPFGFGGIATMPRPDDTISPSGVPGDLVLAEHLRLGSTRVILSRAFTRRASTLAELVGRIDLGAEVRALREREAALDRGGPMALAAAHVRLKTAVAATVDRIQAERAALQPAPSAPSSRIQRPA